MNDHLEVNIYVVMFKETLKTFFLQLAQLMNLIILCFEIFVSIKENT